MPRTKLAAFKKPTITDEARKFAEQGQGNRSGLVPAGDARLTANIRADLHTKLRIRAVQEHSTVGELIEQWVETWD